MLKQSFYFSLIVALLLSGFALAQDEPSDYEVALERIEEAKLNEATSLYFYDLDLSALPPEIGQLTNLQTLDIYGGTLGTLPPEIGQLTNLRSLNAGSNHLRSLPPEIGQLTNLRHLYVGSNELSSLPSEIGNLTNLRTLSLGYNQLSSLPASIGNLSFLEELNLGNNLLSQLPSEIGQLSNLFSLYVGENRLSSLPEAIGQLSNLNYLHLYVNRLTELPASFGNLSNLRSLDLSGNALSTLPASIGLLTNLEELDLRENHLSNLPAEIGTMNNLNALYLEDNPLSSLPFEINNLDNVYRVYLDENQSRLFTPETRYLDEGSQTVTSDLTFTLPVIHFVFSGEEGKTVLLSLESDEFDTYLILLNANGEEIARNDDMAGWGSSSEIGALELPYTGEYTVVVSSYAFLNDFDTLQGRFIFRLLWVEDRVAEVIEVPAEATQAPEATAEATAAPDCAYGNYLAPECPDSQIQTAASVQHFESGRMIWLQVDGSISVFYNNGTYLSGLFGGGGDALPEVTAVPDGLLQPQLGFGYVWLNTAGVREGLGWATSGENYYTAVYEQLGQESASSQYVYLSLSDGSSIWLHPYTHTWGGN